MAGDIDSDYQADSPDLRILPSHGVLGPTGRAQERGVANATTPEKKMKRFPAISSAQPAGIRQLFSRIYEPNRH